MQPQNCGWFRNYADCEDPLTPSSAMFQFQLGIMLSCTLQALQVRLLFDHHHMTKGSGWSQQLAICRSVVPSEIPTTKYQLTKPWLKSTQQTAVWPQPSSAFPRGSPRSGTPYAHHCWPTAGQDTLLWVDLSHLGPLGTTDMSPQPQVDMNHICSCKTHVPQVSKGQEGI